MLNFGSSVSLFADKCGCSAIFDEFGEYIQVTLLRLRKSFVFGLKTKDKDGYDALVVMGLGEDVSYDDGLSFIKKGKGSRFSNITLHEIKVDDVSKFNIGDPVGYDVFSVGQSVDITGISQGKGFAGAMKRHGFGGLCASHGVSISHRSHGSTGQCQDPGRVFKGKKMAGHMGAKKVTVQNLSVMDIDSSTRVVVVKGSVPGHKMSSVLMSSAVKSEG